jgi:hypothetical protein
MPWVYLFPTVFAGFGFFWLRRDHLTVYGVSEIIASLALMYVAYFPHGGFSALGDAPPAAPLQRALRA